MAEFFVLTYLFFLNTVSYLIFISFFIAVLYAYFYNAEKVAKVLKTAIISINVYILLVSIFALVAFYFGLKAFQLGEYLESSGRLETAIQFGLVNMLLTYAVLGTSYLIFNRFHRFRQVHPHDRLALLFSISSIALGFLTAAHKIVLNPLTFLILLISASIFLVLFTAIVASIAMIGKKQKKIIIGPVMVIASAPFFFWGFNIVNRYLTLLDIH